MVCFFWQFGGINSLQFTFILSSIMVCVCQCFCGASSEVFLVEWLSIMLQHSAHPSVILYIGNHFMFIFTIMYYLRLTLSGSSLRIRTSEQFPLTFWIQFMQIWTTGDWIIEAQNIIDLLCASLEPERVKKFSSFFLWHQHKLGNCWSCKNSISAFASTFIYWSCRWLIYYHFLVSC